MLQAATSRHRFVPVRAPDELNQLLGTGSMFELQELQKVFSARMDAVQAHLDMLRPLHEDAGAHLSYSSLPT